MFQKIDFYTFLIYWKNVRNNFHSSNTCFEYMKEVVVVEVGVMVDILAYSVIKGLDIDIILKIVIRVGPDIRVGRILKLSGRLSSIVGYSALLY